MSISTLRPVEATLLDQLTLVVGRVEALSPEEARQAHGRLLADRSIPADQVELLAVADLETLLLERMGCV